MLRHGIDCVFLSQDGHYFGRLFASDSGFGLLRQRQYLALADPNLRLRVARSIVAGKVANQLALLRHRGIDEAQLGTLRELAGQIPEVSDHGRLLGIEGQASALYYGLYRRLFKVDLGFQGRTRRPPRDPVNFLLSLGYTLLTYAAQSAVYAVGLDPFGGFLHSTQYSRPSLALDLIEEFRVLVDGLVLRLVNLRRYQAGDFRRADEESGAVLLTDEARKRYLADFEGLMGRTVKYPGQERPVPVRRALELQARQLARLVLGQQDGYRPILRRSLPADSSGGLGVDWSG
jgi:CRISPR-associated protein Cas1